MAKLVPHRRAPFGFQLPDREQATEMWVVRHGESSWNASGRYQGQTDVPLSQLGRLQVVTLAARLTGQQFDAVYSSDLERSHATAAAVAERLAGHPEVRLDPGLREIDVGKLAGLTAEVIQERYPDYLQALSEDSWATQRPGGESMQDLYIRSSKTFHELRERHPGGRILVFTHGGLVRVAVGLALGEDAGRQAWSRLSVTNSSITRIILGHERGTLLGFNDDAHLEDLLAATESDDVVGQVL